MASRVESSQSLSLVSVRCVSTDVYKHACRYIVDDNKGRFHGNSFHLHGSYRTKFEVG